MSGTTISTTTQSDSKHGNVNDVVTSWLLTDIIPVVAAIILFGVLITGITSHILIIISFKKANVLTHPTFKVIIHTAILDILALFLVVAPDFITACVGTWPFKTGLCILQASFVTTLFVMNMTFCVWLCFERCLKFIKIGWWNIIFENNNGRIFLIVIVSQWIVTFIYSVLPLSGVAELEYQKYGLQCDRTHSDSPWLMNVHFTISYFLTLFLCVLCSVLVMYKRIIHAYDEDIEESDMPQQSSYSRHDSHDLNTTQVSAMDHNQPSTSTGYVNENMIADNDKHDDKPNNDVHKNERTVSQISGKHIRKVSKSMWDIKCDVEDHQLASTIVLSSLMIFLFWLPYVITAYVYTYPKSSALQLKILYPISMMFANIGFTLRPITYMIHNKKIRNYVKNIFPSKAAEKYKQYDNKRKETIAAIREKINISKHMSSRGKSDKPNRNSVQAFGMENITNTHIDDK